MLDNKAHNKGKLRSLSSNANNGSREQNNLFQVQFVSVPGSGERLAIIPESTFRLLEEIAKSQQMERRYTTREMDLPASVQRQLEQGLAPVRVIRKWRQLSGTKLSRLAGITPSMLSQIEVQRKCGSVETYARLSAVLNVPMDILVHPRKSTQ